MTRGSAGGRETLRRYGVEHFREIGKRGFESVVAKRWQGDRQGCLDWLRAKAHERHIESFVDREQARRLAAGEKVVCHELPMLDDPDNGPPF